ncbi:GlsB/YeaQ/YmgE family stress response membrane protein [Tersicoccus sp. MR15.9]|uniref:GlsB/YeaQ/YmgE family stress response membrane protein n=1 Tax=Tersicoccus mangrovi TaxID=3121635 RepID=UPI002FE5CD8D
MGIIAWIVLGLIAGAIAKAILPGRQGGGWIATLILGVIGALLGGWIASAIFGLNVNNGLTNIWTWVFAIIGGVIVAAIWQWIQGRMGSRTRS